MSNTVKINGRNVRYQEFEGVWDGLHDLVLDHLPKGNRDVATRRGIEQNKQDRHKTMPSLSVEIERGWAINGRIAVNFEQEYDQTVADNKREAFTAYNVSVELSWSSSHWNVSQAQACTVLHQEIVNLAALVEANYGGLVGFVEVVE